MSKDIVLKHVSIDSFMGIDKSNPVVLDLAKHYAKGKNITTLSGNQGTRKTSTISALLFLLGANFDFDKDNLINITDDTINLENEFEVDGEQYRVKATKSRFLLEKLYANPGKEGKWVKEDSPKETLRKLIGNLGLSPMFLKEQSGEKQIDWFRRTFSDEENSKKETSIKTSLGKLVPARREANREYKRLQTVLNDSDLFINWEDSERRFKKEITIEAEQKKLNDLGKAADEYRNAENGMAIIGQQIESKTNEIERLEAALKVAKDEKEALLVRKTNGDEYLAQNVMAKTDYDDAQREFRLISQQLLEQKEWKEIKKLKDEMDQYETLVQDADAKKDKLKLDLMKVTKKYLPEIDGLEIKIATGMDDEEEGIYFEGKTMAQLSESELWGLFFKIWEQKDVRFVFIENVSSLGTDAVAILNMLAKNDVKIFATQMDRKKQSMKISFTDTVD